MELQKVHFKVLRGLKVSSQKFKKLCNISGKLAANVQGILQKSRELRKRSQDQSKKFRGLSEVQAPWQEFKELRNYSEHFDADQETLQKFTQFRRNTRKFSEIHKVSGNLPKVFGSYRKFGQICSSGHFGVVQSTLQNVKNICKSVWNSGNFAEIQGTRRRSNLADVQGVIDVQRTLQMLDELR